MMKKSLSAVVLSALAVVAFSGCSGEVSVSAGDDKTGTPSAATTSETAPSSSVPVMDPEMTARTMTAAITAGDPVACDLMTKNMQEITVSMAVRFGVTEEGATCEEYVSGLPAFMEKSGVTEPLTVKSVTVDSETDTEAVVTVAQTNGTTTNSNSYRLVNTSGTWMVDAPTDSSAESEDTMDNMVENTMENTMQ